jgi:hypothetical protein
LAATVTLVYNCSLGIQIPSTTAVAAVDITQELPALGMTVNSDVTALVGSTVQRTIVLNVGTFGNRWFPSNDLLIAATQDLYSQKIGLQVPCYVQANTPVVA